MLPNPSRGLLTLGLLISSFSPAALNNSEAVDCGSDFSNSAQSTLPNSGETALSKAMTRLSTSLEVWSSTHERIAAKLLCSLHSTMIDWPQASAIRCKTSCFFVKTKKGTVCTCVIERKSETLIANKSEICCAIWGRRCMSCTTVTATVRQ